MLLVNVGEFGPGESLHVDVDLTAVRTSVPQDV
jgi:hypothetical protein